MENAISFYDENGFVGFSDAIERKDVTILKDAFDDAVSKGDLDPAKLVDGNDAIFLHPIFEKYSRDERMVSLSKNIFRNENGVQLQHAKLINKPKQKGEGLIEWHQDYPFFPHTNLDLIAVGIHFDDENEDSGPMCVVPGSHKWGFLSHCEDNKFAYRCTDKKMKIENAMAMTCPAGTVTIHHCLVLHQSAPKRNERLRRFLVYQYRTCDNVQLSGVIWNCTGNEISPTKGQIGTVRFMDGNIVENRGMGGRLYDKFTKLTSDK